MAQIIIDGLTDKIIDGLCRKWGYATTIIVRESVEVPDTDPEAEKGAIIVEIQSSEAPNPQSKFEFVQERLNVYIKNQYRSQLRSVKQDLSRVAADEEVEAEVKLTNG